jgi:hypothetical protein
MPKRPQKEHRGTWQATRLEGAVRNAGIKPVRKQKRT